MVIYGKDFPFLLYSAAYRIVKLQPYHFPWPKKEQFWKAPHEVTSHELWHTLRELYVWLTAHHQPFPFSRPEIFAEPQEMDVVGIAQNLLEMAMLAMEGHPSPEAHRNPKHFGECPFCLGCYTNLVGAFVGKLYNDTNFRLTLLRTPYQSQPS